MAEREVMLQNADGEIKGQARVQVDLARGICNLVGGWKKFLIDNKVTVGSTMSFNFVSSSDNIIEFQYVDMVRDKDKLFEYVKCTRQGYELTAPCETKDHARREPENIPLNTESDVDHAGKTWNFSKEMKKYNAHRLVNKPCLIAPFYILFHILFVIFILPVYMISISGFSTRFCKGHWNCNQHRIDLEGWQRKPEACYCNKNKGKAPAYYE